MKLILKLLLSLGIGAACLWFALRNVDLHETVTVLKALPVSAIVLYAITLAITHFFRAWRWEYLLRPIGVTLPLPRLLAISSVGFMAILALPVRLGEFIRPYYVVRDRQSRMSAVLGTVAVERIVDGLVISILFFVCYVASPSHYNLTLRLTAWGSLGGFLALTAFLSFALRWPDATIRIALGATFLSRFSPHLAERIADKLRALIQGFRVLHDPQRLVPFMVQTVLYWGVNGFGMWLLAQQMGLGLSIIGAYATMAFTGVLISLPNSPGLVGQFHAGILAGLGAYLPATVLQSHKLAYAIALHGIQFVWYVAAGLLALVFVGGRTGSLRDVVVESKRAAAQSGSGAP